MVRPGSTLYLYFDTFAAATGAPITMTNFAVGDIKIYKNGGTTERASTSGFTLLDTDGVDFDAITGIQGFSIDLSDNSDAGFYVAGARYQVVVSTVTIDSQTVSFLAGSFQIGYPEAIINTTIATLASQTSFTLTAGPAEDDALNGCELVIHDIASAVQVGRGIVQDYMGSTKTVTLVAAPTFTIAAGDNAAVFLSALQPTTQGRTLDVSTGGEAGLDWGNVGSSSSTIYFSGTTILGLGGTIISFDALWTKVKNAFKLLLRKDSAAAYDASAVLAEINENLGAGAGAFANSTDSVEAIRDRGDAAWVTGTSLDAAGVRAAVGLASANLDTQLSTIESQTDDIGTAGAGLTAVPWNAAWDAEVQSEVDDALDSVIADSVAADGSRPSVRQALLMMTRFLMEREVVSTTVTVNKEDGTTSSMTFTLDSATAPTSITRAS